MEQAWNTAQQDSPIYQVCNRVKCCRVALLKFKVQYNLNSRTAINRIKGRMKELQQKGQDRNSLEWKNLQEHLGKEYRKEKVFWQQKSRIQWLKDSDQNTKFFHAYTMQRRKRNYIERLFSDQG